MKILRSSENHAFIFRLKEKTLMIQEALSLFDAFLEETDATIVSSKGIDAAEIIADYFAPNPPFGGSKDK